MNNMRHELKLWIDQYDAMVAGIKRADVRRCDDRPFRRNDEVLYRQYSGLKGEYSGRALLGRVTHLTKWAGDLELLGRSRAPGRPAAPGPLITIVVLSIEILEIGTYDRLKTTAILNVDDAEKGGRP